MQQVIDYVRNIRAIQSHDLDKWGAQQGEHMSKKITVAILTMSDKASRGEREDLSYGVIVETLKNAIAEAEIVFYRVVPDEQAIIRQNLIDLADEMQVELVLTTGGTGLSPRDVTPEATMEAITTIVPGLAEAMRAESLKKTPAAMISRAVAGIRKRTLIINLPGSPKGAKECLEVVSSAIPHAIEVMKGEVGDHYAP